MEEEIMEYFELNLTDNWVIDPIQVRFIGRTF